MDDTVLDEFGTTADFFNVCYTRLDLAINTTDPVGVAGWSGGIWHPLFHLKSAGLC